MQLRRITHCKPDRMATPHCELQPPLPTCDFRRAGGVEGARHDLTCNPWCLFNLTADIGERNDLGVRAALLFYL